MKDRRKKILQIAGSKGFDAVAAFQPENVFYLTNFWGEGIALCNNDKAILIVPNLEVPRAQLESVDCELITSDRGANLINAFLNEAKGKVICGDNADYLTVQAVQNGNPDCNFTVNPDTYFEGRMVKDESEVYAISSAAKSLDALYEICVDEIKVGLEERSLQAKLMFEAAQMGANIACHKFTLNPLIIASGPHGALPHAQVTDRRFANGDMIVVDLTFRHASYIADATRTFALGRATSEMREVYSITEQAQQVGIDCAIENSSCEQVDQACRNLVSSSGYGNQFMHSTGHGIGLEVHEPPWLKTPNQQVLRKNMAITVEPGIYLHGKFGVRIEDSIIVGEGHARNLNTFTKDLLVIE
ncbi:MAG TPA: aminopeptidase P family protein [Candidatus Nitrosopolaris sp.]|nr:aminopeptidase P family protein [Candidatus Nitrosopolaris sp.]